MEPGDGSVFTGFTLGLLTIDLDRGTVSGEHGSNGLTPRATVQVPGCASAPICCVVRSAAPVRGNDAPHARFPNGRRKIFSPCD